jgi:PKD repeat protein
MATPVGSVPVNHPPVAVISANPLDGAPPLLVNFSGTGSGDPDIGDSLTYAWDLDNDGAFDDSTSPTPSHTYTELGNHTVRLLVTDSHSESAPRRRSSTRQSPALSGKSGT